MKKTISILSCLFFIGILSVQSQSIFGKWKTIDDETGNEKSIVEIYQKDGKAYAKIVKLLEKDKERKVCENCKGINKNNSNEEIIYNLL